MSIESIPPSTHQKKGMLGFESLNIAIIIVWGLVITLGIIIGFFVFKNYFTNNSGANSPKSDTQKAALTEQESLSDFCTDDTIYTSIEDALKAGNPEDICTLNLAEQNLSELPQEITSFKNLTTLGLGGNKFITIPSLLGELKKLRNVGLIANGISSIPDDVSFLSSLKILDLSANPLTDADIQTLKASLPNTQVRYLKEVPAFIQPKSQ